ncbi:MAG: ammonium transporter [Chloroflexota bacterium]|nr:MAG: ammonium transporter [Chloroflexota bacterium]
MDISQGLAALAKSGDVLFLVWGAVLVFSMHAGFAFLEAGTVRRKNVVNAFTKIIVDWAFSTVAYFFVGFPLAYGISFLIPAAELQGANHGFSLVRFFFMLTFAAAVPAIISGGIAERAKFLPQAIAGGIIVGLIYPFFEAMVWGQFDLLGQPTAALAMSLGAPFHDYAGSVVVHAVGGWLALPAMLVLGPRIGRWVHGRSNPLPSHSIPFISLGSWLLMIGWFGFNVGSAGGLQNISGLVAVNSLLALVGGALAALLVAKGESIALHNGALAGLIAVCAGSDVVHPVAALLIGAVAGLIFVFGSRWEAEHLKIDDVLGVWPLHGLAGTWGGVAAGIFGSAALGGLGGVNLGSQVLGTLVGITLAMAAGFVIYKTLDLVVGLRLTPEQEERGCDLCLHGSEAYPEDAIALNSVSV